MRKYVDIQLVKLQYILYNYENVDAIEQKLHELIEFSLYVILCIHIETGNRIMIKILKM